MEVALIGYGYWGKIIKRYIEKSNKFHIKYICSKELEHKGIYIEDIDLIIKDSEIEAVFLCTPISTHYELCSIMLENGKHVFCEKPTVKYVAEFEKLYKLALAKERILFTDYIYTVSPSINYIKQHLKEIGKLQYISGRIEQYGNFYNKDTVYEIIGVHLISSVLFLTDEKIINTKKIDYLNTKNCLIGQIFFELESGCKVDIKCSLLSTEKIRKLTLYGEYGLAEFSMNSKPTVRIIKYNSTGHSVEIIEEQCKDLDENNNLSIIIDEYYKCILQKECSKNLLLSKDVINVINEIDKIG